MIKKVLLFLVFTVLIICPGSAQEESIGSKTDTAKKSRGDRAYEAYSFKLAIDIYKKQLEKDPEGISNESLIRLGNAYYFNANYAKAAEAYGMLVKRNEGSNQLEKEIYFRYARSLKSAENPQLSEQMMTEFMKMAGIDTSEKYIHTNRNSEIEKESFNIKTWSDFAPSFYKEGLIFSSDRDTGNLARYRHTWNGRDFLDLYMVNADSLSSISPVKFNFEKDFTSRVHESTSVFTKDGQTMYFTGNDFKDGSYRSKKDGIVRLKIYKAKLMDGEWKIQEDLSINSEDYSVAHPALSPDERTLYFVSDARDPISLEQPGAGGLYGTDLFSVALDDDGNTTGEKTLLGGTINTDMRETFPFVSEEGILYFASDGHEGNGGLDIYSVDLNKDLENQQLLHLGDSINSSADDFSLIFNSETRKGYFASNRDVEDPLDDNIYSFEEKSCIQNIKGTVRDKIDNRLLIGATVRVFAYESEDPFISTITDENGVFNLTLDRYQGNTVRVLIQGYQTTETFLTEVWDIRKTDCSKPMELDLYLEPEPDLCEQDLSKLFKLDDVIYFDFDKDIIKKEAEKPLMEFVEAMLKYPSLKIDIYSHTDSRGTKEYNKGLSTRRAKATVEFIVSKGVSRDRLRYSGCGEDSPVNNCVDGVSCSRQKHQDNRRSEFIINCEDEPIMSCDGRLNIQE